MDELRRTLTLIPCSRRNNFLFPEDNFLFLALGNFAASH
jgi:hypothetical protein